MFHKSTQKIIFCFLACGILSPADAQELSPALRNEMRLQQLEESNRALQNEVDILRKKIEDEQKEKKAMPAPQPSPPESPKESPQESIGAVIGGAVTDMIDNVGTHISDADALYELAQGALKTGNYQEAEDYLTSFLTHHKSHPLAANARYWLGESFYGRYQYEKAAQQFGTSYEIDPQGAKAPDNLLKLALSLNALDKKKEACNTLKLLATRFPDARASLVVRQKKEYARLECS